MGYSTRVAVQQGGVNEPLIGAVVSLAATDTLAHSTQFEPRWAFDFLACNPPPYQVTTDFSNSLAPVNSLFATENIPFNSTCFGGLAVTDKIFYTYQSSVGGQLGLFRIPAPNGGTYVPAFNAYTMPDSYYDIVLNTAPSAAFDSSAEFQIFCGLERGGTSAPGAGSGAIFVSPATLTITYPDFWGGDDTTTAAFSCPVVRPEGSGASALNRLLFAGAKSGAPQPLMIECQINGTEIGRFWIELSDPTWNDVFLANLYQGLYPCEYGWYCTLSAPSVLPPTFLVFDPGMTKYWVYSIIGLDEPTLAAVFVPSWGNTNAEKISIAEPFSGEGTGGEVTIWGAPGNFNLVMTNKLLSRAVLPIVEPIPLQCVPCVPQSILGNTWAGSLTGGG